MTRETCPITGEDLDILQEIMNIAFGQAAADLAEVINIFVVLSVPHIQVLQGVQLPQYLRSELADSCNISIVEQVFRGRFAGSAFLVFPAGAGKELIALLDGDGGDVPESGTMETLEKETFMEVGNILIGACVGKMSELLGDVVTYAPPQVLVENHPGQVLPDTLFDPEYTAIVMKTLFRFDNRDLNGFLFLITTEESLVWVQKALHEFLDNYA